MNKMIGIELPSNPYEDIVFVGTLLFAEYPTTIIYANKDGNPVIKEWVDCSENNKINRYFSYMAGKKYLKKFIDGSITHIDLIESSIESYVIFQDIENKEVLTNVLLSISSIPSNYRPSNNFTFDSEDGVDTEEIVNWFDLNNIKLDDKDISIVERISTKAHSETIYYHLDSGKGVGYGRVSTEVLGKTLINFDKLYKSVALDHILGINRGDISLDAKKNEEYTQYTDTEIFGEAMRASYGFLIRPKVVQSDAFGQTETEKIARKAFSLIKHSLETELLKSEYILHSGFTIKSYKDFLEDIYKLRLRISLDWFNPVNKDRVTDKIDYIQANKVLNDINNLSVTDTKEFRAIGKFRAVNCDTRHFTFTSTLEEQYTGYFDKLLKDGLVIINFIDIYEISITRRIVKEAGSKDEKTLDSIIAYYKK